MTTRRELLMGAAAFAGSLVLPDVADAREKRRRGRNRRAAAPRSAWRKDFAMTLAEENASIDEWELYRYETLDDLMFGIDIGELVPIDWHSRAYELDSSFAANDKENELFYSHVAPEAHLFLETMLPPIAEKFGVKFRICSLTRPRDYQEGLAKKDRGAARGDKDENQSGHMTGHVIDLAMGDLGQQSLPARTEFRNNLLDIVGMGLAKARMEWRRGCMHILVLPPYVKAVEDAREYLRTPTG